MIPRRKALQQLLLLRASRSCGRSSSGSCSSSTSSGTNAGSGCSSQGSLVGGLHRDQSYGAILCVSPECRLTSAAPLPTSSLGATSVVTDDVCSDCSSPADRGGRTGDAGRWTAGGLWRTCGVADRRMPADERQQQQPLAQGGMLQRTTHGWFSAATATSSAAPRPIQVHTLLCHGREHESNLLSHGLNRSSSKEPPWMCGRAPGSCDWHCEVASCPAQPFPATPGAPQATLYGATAWECRSTVPAAAAAAAAATCAAVPEAALVSRRQFSIFGGHSSLSSAAAAAAAAAPLLPHLPTAACEAGQAAATGVEAAGASAAVESVTAASVDATAAAAAASAAATDELAAAVADAWLPTAALEYFINGIHVYCGLPWWLSIAAATVAVRSLLFPLFLYQIKAAGRSAIIQPQLAKMADRVKAYNYSPEEVERYQKGARELMRKHKVTPLAPLLGVLTQGSTFIFFYYAIHNMAQHMPSFKTGGALWFADLATPDPLYILPAISGFGMLLALELGAEGMEAQAKQVSTAQMKMFMRGMALVSVPITAAFPKAIFCYWITNNVLSLLQGSAFRVPKVRSALGIPPIPKPGTNLPAAGPPPSPAAAAGGALAGRRGSAAAGQSAASQSSGNVWSVFSSTGSGSQATPVATVAPSARPPPRAQMKTTKVRGASSSSISSTTTTTRKCNGARRQLSTLTANPSGHHLGLSMPIGAIARGRMHMAFDVSHKRHY